MLIEKKLREILSPYVKSSHMLRLQAENEGWKGGEFLFRELRDEKQVIV